MKLRKYIKVIPFITLFTGLIISGIMFYNVAVSPLLNPEELVLNAKYEIGVKDEQTVTIFIDEEEINRLVIEDFESYKRLTYYIDDIKYDVLLNVLSTNESNQGFDVTVIEKSNPYSVESLRGIYQIHFDEQGTYNFAMLTYDGDGTGFYMVTTEVIEARRTLITSIIIASVTVVGSLTGLYFVLKNPKKDE